MLEQYNDLIRRFHRALIRRDRNALAGLLTEHAAANLQIALQEIDEIDWPITDDVSVSGIEIEGNGKVIRVHYTNRHSNEEYPMIVDLTDEGDGIKIAQRIPHLIR